VWFLFFLIEIRNVCEYRYISIFVINGNGVEEKKLYFEDVNKILLGGWDRVMKPTLSCHSICNIN